MQNDTKNIILAIVLSITIIVGWQFFVAGPQMEKQRRQQAQQTQQQKAAEAANPQAGPTSSAPKAPGSAPQTPANVPAAGQMQEPLGVVLAKTPRIEIETDKLKGTINLAGARLDDLNLLKYKETTDPDSKTIKLLLPSGTKGAFFAEQGWASAAGANTKVPDTKSVWTVKSGKKLTTSTPVTLSWDNGEGLVFEREISIDDAYMFTVKQQVINNTDKPVALFPYSRVQRQGVPKLQGIYVIHEGLIGVLDDKLEELKYKEAKDDAETVAAKSTGGWVGITDKYWAVASIPEQNKAFEATMKFTPIGALDGYQADYVTSEPVTVAAGGKGGYTNMVFAGAKVVKIIDGYMDKYNITNFERLVDWGWFYFLTKPMFWLLDIIYGFVGNFGFAILIITLIVKALFFPLANKSYKSMARMKQVQPEMQAIKERYKDDKAEQQKKMMELYKNKKVSPLSGCLPMLLQIPVFFSLYKVLFVTIEMRHAPFILWIKDLSAPDPTTIFNLFGLLPFDPPQILAIGILPLIMGITMWIQMKLNPAPPDPVQAQLFNIMPIAFTFILGSFPAGLVLYWAWNNTLSIIQQYTIMKQQGTEVNLLKNMKDGLPSFLKKKKP